MKFKLFCSRSARKTPLTHDWGITMHVRLQGNVFRRSKGLWVLQVPRNTTISSEIPSSWFCRNSIVWLTPAASHANTNDTLGRTMRPSTPTKRIMMDLNAFKGMPRRFGYRREQYIEACSLIAIFWLDFVSFSALWTNFTPFIWTFKNFGSKLFLCRKSTNMV